MPERGNEEEEPGILHRDRAVLMIDRLTGWDLQVGFVVG
jgi:hypothetical protein